MAIFEQGGMRIHHTGYGYGSGFPVLALAPAGMRSAAPLWERSPWNPIAELAGSYRVIVRQSHTTILETTTHGTTALFHGCLSTLGSTV